jgi:hypothetical protein
MDKSVSTSAQGTTLAMIRAALIAKFRKLMPQAPIPVPVGDFVQRRNPLANAKRKAKRAIGARQYRKQTKRLNALRRDGVLRNLAAQS